MEGGALCWLPSSSHHPNANKPAMQPTAITIRPLIMVNVSSLTLNIPHLHRDIAGDQPDCRRLGSRFLWLRCNDPIFYCGKEMAETRRWQGLRVDHGDCAARGLAAGPGRLPASAFFFRMRPSIPDEAQSFNCRLKPPRRRCVSPCS
jgi:hypothetical protein